MKKYNLPIIVSTHPRTALKLKKFNIKKDLNNIIFLKPLGFIDYVFLQMNSKLVISDSGTITEEASILNLPAVTIRNTHERPEGFDNGTLIMSGLNFKLILKSIEVVLSQHDYDNQNFDIIQDYNSKNVSSKILRIVLSYIKYINENI